MKTQYGQGCSKSAIGHDLHLIIKFLKGSGWFKNSKSTSLNTYASVVIRYVLQCEPNEDSSFKTRCTGEVNFFKLSHVRFKACDPHLSWIMFYRICDKYRAAFKTMNDKVTERA